MEVPILGRRADLVGSRGATVAAIEMKMHRWGEALRQAIAYQLGANRVSLASSPHGPAPLFRVVPCSRWYPQANRAAPSTINGTPSSRVSNANRIAEKPMRNTPTWVSLSPRLK